METLIKTPKSSLNVYDIDTIFENVNETEVDKNIIEKCVEEIKDKLLKNPRSYCFWKTFWNSTQRNRIFLR